MKGIAEIERDLKGIIKGEVLFDRLSRIMYSTAACIYRIEPLGAVTPRDREDVINLVNYAASEGISLTGRGAGSGLAGQALGEGIIVDFSRFMNRILEINREEGWALVEPGVVQGVLNDALKGIKMFFPPDPSTSDYCTLGGMISNNSSGTHSVKYGNTIDYVMELEVVLADGTVLNPRETPSPIPEKRGDLPGPKKVEKMLKENHTLINQKFSTFVDKNCCGYRLDKVFQGDGMNLSKLFSSAEGTLGLITSARLKVVEKPKVQTLALLYFDDLDKAGEAVDAILTLRPSALEIMDERCLARTREVRPDLSRFVPPGIEAELLVEFDGSDKEALSGKMAIMEERICRVMNLATGMEKATGAKDQERLWSVRKAMLPILHKIKGPKKVTSFIEDAAVEPAKLPQYIRGLHRILDGHGVEFILFGHAGQGNIHTRPFLNLKDPAEVEKMGKVSEEVHELVMSLGGTVSAEHADGLARTQFVRRQYGPVYPVLQEVKKALDPKGIMNPGKIINEAPNLMTQNLRYGPGYRTIPMTPLLNFPEGIAQDVEQCHGCGQCRTILASVAAMCPIFKSCLDEKASPRAKANLMRAVLSGKLEEEALYSREFKEAVDLCVNCKMCYIECPSSVNVPKLMTEAKARFVKGRGQSLANRFLGLAPDIMAPIGSLTAPAANLMLKNPLVRKAMELTTGIDSRRNLPPFRRETLIGWWREWDKLTGGTVGDIRVAYFVDTFANYNDPSVGKAVVAVLERNGIEVHLPPQRGCGMPLMDYGSLNEAKRVIRYNAHHMSKAVREGCVIVSSEPTAALCLKEEYLMFEDDEDVRLVARNTFDLFEFLRRLHQEGKLNTEFRRVEARAGYHAPCHLKAMKIGLPGLEMMRLIPGLTVYEIEEGCCGIAGTYGFKKDGFDRSMAIGQGLFRALIDGGADFGLTECGTCRMQMEQGTGMEVMHPAKLLAQAYGLS